MEYNEHINYFYKTSSLNAFDDKEKCIFELTNEYGYNFDSEKRKANKVEKLTNKTQNSVNKEYIKQKR